MHLEGYFDFHSPIDIRLKGSAIGVEVILSAYLDLALFAEEISDRYASLTLEQIYATLTYYWRSREMMDSYLQQVRAIPDRLPSTAGMTASPASRRLLDMVSKRDERSDRQSADRHQDTRDPMELEDCFDFLLPIDIRIRGSRVGIETVLWDYLNLSLHAEDIAVRYPTLTLEQVYATITYYLHNREQVDAYLYRVETEIKRQREEFERNLPPGIARLRGLARQREQERAQALLSAPA